MKKEINCLVCNKKLEKKQRKFCSKECKNKYFVSEKRKEYQLLQNERRISNKLALINELGGKCSVCGYNKNISALDFHHLDKSKKEFNLSSNISYKYDRLFKEIKSCVLLCSNCHRETHHPDLAINIVSNRKLNHNVIEKKKNVCSICNKNVSSNSKSLCKKCFNENRTNKNKPDKKELLELIKSNSFTKLGERFGISDNGVRKWCKEYNLPYSLKDIKLLNK